MNLLTGIKVLEERESKFNGKITAVKSLAWGTYLQVGGLTQSGGVVSSIWKKTLENLKRNKKNLNNSLILGLGGGTVATIVNKNWPEVKITGVDIDPTMIEMGQKYLGLNKINPRIEVTDAYDFLKSDKEKYDLIIVDTYRGDEFPEKLTSDKFLIQVKKHLDPGGVAIFNRLYLAEKRKIAQKFGEKLQKIFAKVEYFFPEANLMFLSFVK